MQRDRRVGSTEPSPVEASSHEGLKVDGAGERCKGAAQTGEGKRCGQVVEGMGDRYGVTDEDMGEEQQSNHKMKDSS